MLKIIILFALSFNIFADDLRQIYLDKGENYKPRTKHLENGKAKFVNHLIKSNSPYLLQHAHNPINWREFNQETLDLAKKENKLIFISIGYATCHWCHVMEEESFEDLTVAKILNDNFISIKVDKEVLPDVDAHFMQISLLLNGTGGWPLNVVLTPDSDGFFSGIYFPKHQLISTLHNLNNTWKTDKNRILKQANIVKKALEEENNFVAKLPKNLQSVAVKNMRESFDEFYGGFGNAPKFPKETSLLMLLDEQVRNPNAKNLEMITTTLDSMALGGLYDTVGGGFHRYSVDNKWLVPHFEKMIYNQALMSQVYAKAYKLTGNALYKRVAKRTLDYIIRELKDSKGGYYSATDADSLTSSGEKEEGVFFTWSKKKLQDVLGNDFKVFNQYFDTTSFSVFEDNHIIRYKENTNLTKGDFAIIDSLLYKLYTHRETKNKPLLDNKIILSMNALVAKSLLVAGEIIDKKYQKYGLELLNFLDNFNINNNLFRIKVEGNFETDAIFIDYSYLADAYLLAYKITNNIKYLEKAKTLTRSAITRFWDNKNNAFNMSNNQFIYSQKKEIYDGAIPSSNGMMYGVLNSLTTITGDDRYSDFAKKLITTFSGKISKQPQSYATIVGNFSKHKLGDIADKIYLYDGKVVVAKTKNQVMINLAKSWHINGNKVNQKGLVATQISGEIDDIIYPKYTLSKLGFSDEKITTYENQVMITFNPKVKYPKITLNLQACNDEVCLPPTTAILY